MSLHDEAMKELEKLADYYGNDVEDWKIGIYIKQQEKVTELLRLYRHVYFHDKMMTEDEFYQTLYKIKALEGEMK